MCFMEIIEGDATFGLTDPSQDIFLTREDKINSYD